ncbi:MAG: cadherin domain-containing protein [Terricaulis sp.]
MSVQEATIVLASGGFEELASEQYAGDEDVRRRIREAGETGREFGSELAAIINLEDPFADVVLDAVLVVAAGNIAEVIEAGGLSVQLGSGTLNVLQGLPLELVNVIIEGGQNQISSYLSKRLIVAVGIEGFAGDLLGALSQTLIDQLIDVGQEIIDNIVEGKDPYDEVNLDALKISLRTQAEALITSELQSTLADALGLDDDAAAFVQGLINPMIDVAVDYALDKIYDDNQDPENPDPDVKLAHELFAPEAIKERFKTAAQSYLTSALSTAIVDGLGFNGTSIGDQFGKALTEQVVTNVIGALFDDDVILFDAEGVHWDTVGAGVTNIASRFIASAFVSELGLKGPAAELATSLGTQIVSNVLQNGFANAFKGIDAVDFWNALAQIAFSKHHADVMDTLIKNEAGAIGAQIGGVIGAIVGFIYWGGNATYGQWVGEAIGAIIGNWFGKTAETGAQLVYDAERGEFILGSSWKQGGAKRSVAEGIASQVAGAMNGALNAVGGVVLNAEQIKPGHYGMRKDYFTYRESGREDTRARFDDVSALVAFGALNALEEVQIGGGDVFVKRAFYASMDNLRNVNNGAKVYGSESSGFELTGNDLEVLLGDLVAGADYSRYANDPSVINALVSAESDSFFAAGWAVTLQRAIELGLYKRHASDWYGGWALFMDEKADGKVDGKGYTPGNLSLELDADSNERLIWVRDTQGNWTHAIRDTIDTLSKDVIRGGTGNDVVTVTGDVAAMQTGWTLNGAASTAGSHTLKVAALIDGGVGNDTIRGGDSGSDLLGGNGNDTLIGGKLDDWMFGGAGADKLYAGSVADPNAAEATLIAAAGGNGDYLDGGDGADSLYGGLGSDWLSGGAGEDRLVAGSGGDILQGGLGNDGGTSGVASLLGGEGSDQYVFNRGDGFDVIFDVSDPSAQVGVGLYGARAQYLSYTNFDPELGDPRNWAGNGSYEVNGSVKGGEDAISFGAGISIRDLIMRRSTSGNDLIIELRNGPAGDMLVVNDWFDETRRVEWLRFADGQSIRIADISSFIIGTGADDVILGTFGSDFVVGDAGNDTLHLLPGNDFGFGDAGNDLVTGDEDNDWVLGGDGTDQVMGGTGNDTVFGDGGDDQVYGGAGSDIISGGRGNDVVVTGAGDDLVRFMRGDGRDTLFDEFSNAWELVLIGLNPTNGYTTNANGDIEKGGIVYRTNGEWTGQYNWDSATGRLYRHVPTGAATVNSSAGDILEFGIGIDMNDVQVRRVGNDLQMAIGSGDSDATAFEAIADSIKLKEWYTTGAQIEKFVFIETGTFSTGSWEIGAVTTDGDDVVTGHATHQNWITGGLGDDRITGGATYDILFGNAGNDILDGGPAGSLTDTRDRLYGGEGFDYASYASATGGIKLSLANPDHNHGAAWLDELDSIEGIEGSTYADKITGDVNANWLRGIGGNDLLRGHLGDDVYEIGRNEGADVIEDGNVGFEDIRLANGALAPGYSHTYQSGGIYGGGQYYTLYGYILTIWRTSTGELIYQNSFGMGFIENSSSVTAPVWSDTFPDPGWREGGNAGAPYGRQWVREIMSGTEDGGKDTIAFGAGISLSDLTAAWENTNQDLRISIAGGGSTLLGAQYLAHRAIEEIQLADGLIAELANLKLGTITVGSASADLFLGDATAQTFAGGDGDDVISGGAGSDTLSGQNGNDVLEGGAGVDTVSGGAGVDTLRYAGAATAVYVNLAETQARVRSGTTNTATVEDTISGIENILGSEIAGGDELRGDGVANRIAGLGGADLIYGEAGDDTLIGGEGVDTIEGGAENDGIAGDADADTLRGQDGDDQVSGGDGNDIIEGGAGADLLDSGAGDDNVKGGADNDSILGGDGNDLLYGGVNTASASGDDLVDGGAGNDILRGEDGADTLVGGAGNDYMLGGSGDDTYVFNAGDGVDDIEDTAGVNFVVLKGAAAESLWLARVNNDLRIGVIGTADAITLKNFYTTGRIQAIYTATHALYPADAGTLITAMTGASVPGITPASMPAGIAATLSTYWHQGGLAPQVPATVTVTANEHVVLSGQVTATDLDNQTLSYAIDAAAAHGTVTLNAETGAWTFISDDNYAGADSFAIRVSDASGKSSIQTVELTIIGGNDPATALTFANTVTAIAENTSTATQIKVADLVIDDDGLGVNDLVLAGADAASFEIAGSALYLKAGVALNYEAKASYAVTVTVDDTAVGATPDISQAFTLTVTNVNETPSDIVPPGSLTVAENAANGTAIGTFTSADPDAGDTRTYSLVNSAGGRFAINASSGALTVANGALLDYETAVSHSVTVRVTDAVGLYRDETFAVSLTNVNETPSDIVPPGSLTVAENAANGTAIGTFTSADPDAGDTRTYSLVNNAGGRFAINASGALTVANGALLDYDTASSHSVIVRVTDAVGLYRDETFAVSLTNVNEAPSDIVPPGSLTVAENAANGTAIGTFTSADPDAGDTRTYSLVNNAGGRFAINASGALTVANGALLDYDTASSHSVIVRVTDAAGLYRDETFAISLTNVNEAPSDIVPPANLFIMENSANGTAIGTFTSIDPDAGDTRTYSLINNAGGRFAIHATTGALTVANGALLDYETAVSHSVTVRVTDAVGLYRDETFAVSLTNVNEAPSDIVPPGSLTVAENAANGTAIGTFTSADPDAGDTRTYSLVNNAGGRFAINASGALTVANGALLDYDTASSHSVIVRVTDAAGLYRDETFAISLTNVNEAPSDIVPPANLFIMENSANGTAIGTFTSIDPDAGDTRTYSLINNAGGRFAIHATTGALTVANGALLDYETAVSHSITVRVTDAVGLYRDETFAVSLTNVNEAPSDIVPPGSLTVAENAANGTAIGTFTSADPDAGDTRTYSLVNNAGGRFAINASGALTVANGALLDYDTASSHSVIVRVTDAAGLYRDETFAISLTNVNEAPSDIVSPANLFIMENSANGTAIGTFTSIDPDAGDTRTYSLINNAGGRFAIHATTGALTVADGTLLDFETTTDHAITARVTDAAGLYRDETFTVLVTSEDNEAPNDIIPPGSLTVAENAANGAAIGTFTSSDPDAGDTKTYSLTGAAGGRFAINAASGALTVANGALLDYEAASSHPITVRVTDAAGLYREEMFTVSLTTVNEVPTDIVPPASLTVVENATNGTAIGTFTSSDPDVGDTKTYSLANSASGRFAIHATTGALTVANAALLDYEATSSHSITVRVTDAGGLYREEIFSVALTNLNEAPTAISFTNTMTSLAENTSTATRIKVADLSVTDDALGTEAFGLTGADAASFEIIASALYLKAGVALNFEAKSSYAVTVTADDSTVGATPDVSQAFTLTISDVNEAPTALAFANTTTTLAENTSTATRIKVADLVVTDDALGTEAFGLTGADAASFEIIGSALYLKAGVALNLEAKASYAVTVTADDTTVGVTPDVSQTFTLTISDVNEAPTALTFTNTTTSLTENTSTATRIKVADLVVTDDALGSETFGLTGADAASFEIIGATLYLKAGVALNFEAKASYAVTVTADDTAVGATPDLSQAFSLTISDVNEAPMALAFANTTTTLAENTSTAARIKVADLVVTDDALGIETFGLTGADAASFEIIGATLYLKAGVALNFEAKASYAVTVTADDTTVGATPDLSQAFTLTVTDVNEAPTALTFTNTTTSLAENTSTATRIKVADLGVTDDALGTETFGLTGADAASFEIIGSVLYLKAGVALNFEAKASYAVTVTADDATVGATPDLSQAFTLTVTDVNEAPTALVFTNTTTSLAENTSTATRIKVADLVVTDDALGTEAFGLTGADASSFEIIGSALYLKAGVALNFEAKASYDVTVTVDDTTVGATPDMSQAFPLSISDVNEAPTALGFTNTTTTLAENTSTATRIKLADLVVTDDGLGIETFGLTGADASSFEIISSALYLKAGVALNFEAKASYAVTVTADDTAVGATPDLSQAFTLTVSNVNEAPTALALTNTTTSLAESTSTATRIKVADLNVSDDALGTESLGLTGADAASFEIIGSELYLKAGVALNFEAKASYAVTVTADDMTVGATPDLSQSFTLTITDVNEVPTVVSAYFVTSYHMAPGPGPNAPMTQWNSRGLMVVAQDPEGSTSLTWSSPWNVSMTDLPDDGNPLTRIFAFESNVPGPLSSFSAGTNIPLTLTDSSGASRSFTLTSQTNQTWTISPIVFDLNGDGLNLISVNASNVAFDQTGDGNPELTGWVGADDGLLVLDRNGDGRINSGAEISFIGDLSGARSDLEGLRAFDSNGDGVFGVADARFAEFQIWQDANQDGVSQAGELATLGARGIASVDLALALTGAAPEGATDNVLSGNSTYLRSDGTVGVVGDVFFAYTPTTFLVTEVPSEQAVGPMTRNAAPNQAVRDLVDALVSRRGRAPHENDLLDRLGLTNDLAAVLHNAAPDTGLGGVSRRANNELGEVIRRGARRANPLRDTSGDGDFDWDTSRQPPRSVRSPAASSEGQSENVTLDNLLESVFSRRTAKQSPEQDLVTKAASEPCALHHGLALADRRVLHMVNAMASFDPSDPADFSRKPRDPRVAELLTSLPDIRL